MGDNRVQLEMYAYMDMEFLGFYDVLLLDSMNNYYVLVGYFIYTRNYTWNYTSYYFYFTNLRN